MTRSWIEPTTSLYGANALPLSHRYKKYNILEKIGRESIDQHKEYNSSPVAILELIDS